LTSPNHGEEHFMAASQTNTLDDVASPAAPPRPAFPFIAVDELGHASLTAQRCGTCGTIYAESERMACARCGARADAFSTVEPSYNGTLHSASIVRRAYPGIPVPFISAIVDLDGGPTLKGILRGTGLEPADVAQGLRVKVVFDDALGRKDKEGNSYVSHFFEPA